MFFTLRHGICFFAEHAPKEISGNKSQNRANANKKGC
jgi:hypothetical protein